MAVGGVVALFYVEGWDLVPAICATVVGAALTVGTSFWLYREWKNGTLFPKIVSEKERKQGVELAVELPYSLLAARFCELRKYEPTTAADEPSGFLGWGGRAPVHIFHTAGQMLEGKGKGTVADDPEGWLALYWVDDNNYLRDSELAALCRRHKLPTQDDYRKMKATGVAFYRAGTLTLYPAAFEPEFRHHYLTEFLCPEADYREWFSRCYGNGEDEA